MKMGISIALFMIGFVCMSFIAIPVLAFQPQPDPPGHIVGALERLNDLKDLISAYVDMYPRLFTITNTMQQANALYRKIDVVIGMVQQDVKSLEAIKMLEADIAPKLNYCDTTRVRALSWISDEPELQGVAYEFAGECQNLIGQVIMYLAEPLD